MKLRSYSLLLVPLLAITGCDQMQTSLDSARNDRKTPATAETSAAADTSEVVATVNGTPITKAVLDVYASQRMAKGAEDSTPEAMLNELVTLELMRQEADSKGLGSQPVVVASINQLQRSALAGAAIKDFMDKNPVQDEEIKTYYDENIAVPGKEYKARHILVEKEDDAKNIISMLDSGSDFSELAKEKSTDSSGSAGGELGWFSPAQMVKEFSDAAAALEKGSYTKTPVQTQFGWHVILLDDVRDSTPPPLDDVKDRLKMGLANQKLQQHIQQIRETAKIDITMK
jgi:peptidyl-prolyl cis-trans isomerase C